MKKILQLAAGLAFGLVLGTTVSRAVASRDASGTYTLPYPAFIPNTVISSSVMNGTFNDFKAELTDSLDRSGKGGMLAPVRGIDGTMAAPAFSFTGETGSGDYRKAAGSVCRAILGADVACFSATGIVVTGSVTATALVGPLTGAVNAATPSTFAGSATQAPIILTPLATPSAPSNGAIWVDSTTNHLSVRYAGTNHDALVGPIARTDLPAVGQQVSASSGSFSNSGVGEVDVTNLAVTITTTGRPVMLVMQPDGNTTNPASVVNSANAATMYLDRGGSNIALWWSAPANTGQVHAHLSYLDPVAAGTYTYKIRVNPNGAALTVQYFKLVAWEL